MSYDCSEGEEVVVQSTRIQRARKDHVCGCCRRAIRPGDYYAVEVAVFGGDLEHVKRCGSCQRTYEHLVKLCEAFNKAHRADGDMRWPDSRLNCGLDYADEWAAEPPPEVAALPLLTDDEAGRLLARPALPRAER